jgi:hypothetical protein
LATVFKEKTANCLWVCKLSKLTKSVVLLFSAVFLVSLGCVDFGKAQADYFAFIVNSPVEGETYSTDLVLSGKVQAYGQFTTYSSDIDIYIDDEFYHETGSNERTGNGFSVPLRNLTDGEHKLKIEGEVNELIPGAYWRTWKLSSAEVTFLC